MKSNHAVCVILVCALALTGCGSKVPAAPAVTEAPAATAAPAPATQAPTSTPVATATPSPAPTTAPTPTPTAVPTAVPTPVPTAVPVITPTPVPERPFVSKHPLSVTVTEGGSCTFEAGYINAIWAVWHFVSPDGNIDLPYDQIGLKFPQMQVLYGMYSKMELHNVPLAANGWRVYCRYTNAGGYTDTNPATITVTAAAPTAVPTVLPTAVPTPNAYSDWIQTADLGMAIAASGVSFNPPIPEALPAGVSLETYRARAGVIEARYSAGTLVIRKSNTLSGSDLSGDYNAYSQTWEHVLKGVRVLCRGDGNTTNDTTFSSGAYYYSISFRPGREGQGLTLDQINSLVNGMS